MKIRVNIYTSIFVMEDGVIEGDQELHLAFWLESLLTTPPRFSFVCRATGLVALHAPVAIGVSTFGLVSVLARFGPDSQRSGFGVILDGARVRIP